MPIYEYTCQDCRTDFEVIRSFKDADAALHCAQCQGENNKRKISLFNASSGGHSITSNNSSCASCTGGSCSTCGSH